MLVLSRKLGEGIQINENVVVSVLAIHGNRVRIGIAAPSGTPVHRTEVYEAIQNRNVATRKID